MALLLLCGTSTLSAQAPRSLVINTNRRATANVSIGSFGSHTLELRLSNLQASASTRDVVVLTGSVETTCTLLSGTSSAAFRCITGNESAPSGNATVSLAAGGDYRIRVTKDESAGAGGKGSVRIDVWNGDCSFHSSAVKTLTNISAPRSLTSMRVGPPAWQNNNTAGFALGFLRTYSAADRNGCPVDAPDTPANLIDFTFDSNTLAARGAAYTLVFGSGSDYSFVDSPAYPPVATVTWTGSTLPVFRTGAGFTLDGSGSVSTKISSCIPAGFEWTRVSGPGNYSISSAAVAQPTITVDTPGQHVFRLTVTDGTEQRSKDITVGIVAANSNEVITPTGDLATIIGPVTRHGTAPWPWYDAAEAAVVDVLAPAYASGPTAILQSGSVSVVGAPYNTTAVDSKGRTIIQKTNTYSGVVFAATGATVDASLVGKVVALHWDAEGDGTYKGRNVITVTQIIDSTRFAGDEYYYVPPANLTQNVPWSIVPEGTGGYSAIPNRQNTWNYYEALLAVYRLYYRTGMTKYRDQARGFCEIWYRWALDSGYSAPAPRNAAWQSMMACAADNKPEFWPGLAYQIERRVSKPTANVTPYQHWYSYDVREQSYTLRAAALMAKVHPAKTANPAATRANWCGLVKNVVQYFWLHRQTPLGYWEENPVFWGHASYPGSKIDGYWGTAPWRGVGLGTLALQYAYDVLADENVCNEPALASQTMTSITKAADFLWNYGRAPGGGQFYNVMYGSIMQESNPVMVTTTPGTIALTNGSPIITGTNTSFLTTFAPCDGTTYIGIAWGGDADGKYEYNDVFRVLSCQSNTQLTLAVNYPYPNKSPAHRYVKTNVATSNCGPNSIATGCEVEWYDNSGRSISADIAASAGWLFAKTAQPSWKDRAQFYAGKTFGGAAGGPGSVGAPAGPYADGKVGNLAEILPACNTSPPPCGDGVLSSKFGKPLGMAAGAGDVPVMMANIAGVSAAEPPPTATLSASVGSIAPGESVTLTVVSSLATVCSITPGVGSVACNGNVVVSPAASTTYTLTASGSGGTAIVTSDVQVISGPVATGNRAPVRGGVSIKGASVVR